MLKDMLQPPRDDNDGFDAPAEEAKAAAERAIGSAEEEMDAIEASEEWNAAMESEIMKGPKRQGTRGRFTKLPSSLPRVRFLRLSTSRRPIETRGRDISNGHTRA
jgi:hypothetical protein